MTTKFVSVHGNIGAGKSTWISKHTAADDILLTERLDNIVPLFDRFYGLVNGWWDGDQKIPLESRDQEFIIEVSKLFINNRLESYYELFDDQEFKSKEEQRVPITVYVERSIEDNLFTFCPSLSKMLSSENADHLENLYLQGTEHEQRLVDFDKHVIIERDFDNIVKAIRNRNRDGELGMSQNYLHQLQTCYNNYHDDLKTHDPNRVETVYVNV